MIHSNHDLMASDVLFCHLTRMFVLISESNSRCTLRMIVLKLFLLSKL